ncbi:TonB family protein [Arenimonas daejeonensis]|uniref:TonB family protein n=1 Tax=Arenimonas daejeonensis TaxID=370777 RepID=UPI0011BDB930|nr:TonB family protein [Arenimonas daejeonensis]
MAAELFDWLLRATLASSLAILAVLVLRPLWRRCLGAGSVLWLWLLLPAALLATSLPRPTVVMEAAPVVATVLTGEQAVESGVAPVGASSPSSEALPVEVPSSRTAADWLFPVWLAGALALVAWLAEQQRGFLRRLGPLHRRDDGSYLASSRRIGPAVVGALRPRIVLPADFEQRYDPQQRAPVLAHERVHLRRGDLQVNLLMCALRCVFWFNPLVHVAAARLRVDQELACDAVVLRHHPESGRTYATALLNTQLADLGLPVGCYWQSSQSLKWRIAMLKRPLPGSARLLLGAGIALLASSAAAVSLWQVQPVQTVVLPAVTLPARPALPGLERVVMAPAVPALSVSVAPVAADVTLDVPVQLAAAEPRRTSLPEETVAPMKANATNGPLPDPTFQPPRVTGIWLADPPHRASSREYELEATENVVVKVDVDANGRPSNPEVVQSKLGKPYQFKALQAVKRWKFEPARRNGIAVASTVLVPVAFDLTLNVPTQDFWAKPQINSRPIYYGPPIVSAKPAPNPSGN